MNPFALSGLLIGISTFYFACLSYLKNRKKALNIIWSIFNVLVGVWGFGVYKIGLTKDADSALFWWRVVHNSVIFIPVVFLHFVYVFLGKKEKRLILTAYVLGIFFLIVNFTGHLIKNVEWVFDSFYYDGRPPAFTYILFVFLWFLAIVYSHIKLFIALRQTIGLKRTQIKYFFLATLVGYGGGSVCFLPVFGIDIYPYSNFTVSLYPLIMTYAIFRYRLLDIKLAITRTGVFVIVYTFVLGIPFALAIGLRPWLSAMIGLNWWAVPLGAMAALATTGPFFYIYLERRAEERLFKEQKRYQNTLKQASLGMTRIRDLKKLLNLIVYIVTKTVRLTHTSIYLLDKENSHFKMEAVRNVQKKEDTLRIETDSILVGWLRTEREPIVLEELRRRIQDTPEEALEQLKEQMVSLNGSVIVPSFVEDKLLGFMVLGDKCSGDIYTEDDLRVFTVLANQAALAIENARFFEDAKEMQDQISQAEKMATIGTMADGLSHQINNRFHALSLIAGDTMDTIKLTDVNNYSKEQKDLIAQISHALERIQANVIQGGEIVKGMLKYTRKGEEGFFAVTLDNIIDSTLEMVQYKVRLSDIDIIREYSKNTPPVHGNLTQLQEVFFNLIDNAYYAMMERRDMLKEEGYRGKLRIHTESLRSGYLSINIEDNGIGAKPGNLKKMFTPFFTTKASSHKGTGLGLYVIKKIITSHNGKISVESTYGKGTKFIIELPVAKSA